MITKIKIILESNINTFFHQLFSIKIRKNKINKNELLIKFDLSPIIKDIKIKNIASIKNICLLR